MSCSVYLPDDKDLTVCHETFVPTQEAVYRCSACAEIVLRITRVQIVGLGPDPCMIGAALERKVVDAMIDHVRRDEERMGL